MAPQPQQPRPRALVLGSGGLTGLAWQAGVLAGLADTGRSLIADVVVGTSAGAVLAAWLTTGVGVDALDAEVLRWAEFGLDGPAARLHPLAVARLGAAQVFPSRRHALAWLGRRAVRSWSPAAEKEWVRGLVPELSGRNWPAELVVVATDCASGRPAFFSRSQPVDLARAVAASCALPGVFPAVEVDGRLHFDGGLRSPLNLDVAPPGAEVIALAPLAGAVRSARRPAAQAALLGPNASVLLLRPDAASRRAMGWDLLAAAQLPAVIAAGRTQGRRAGA